MHTLPSMHTVLPANPQVNLSNKWLLGLSAQGCTLICIVDLHVAMAKLRWHKVMILSEALHMQVYQEVLDWEPPTAGVRCMLEFGDTTLITVVPDPSTLPPPAPIEVLDQYSQLPMLPCASQDPGALRGAFHEASAKRHLLAAPPTSSSSRLLPLHFDRRMEAPRICACNSRKSQPGMQ